MKPLLGFSNQQKEVRALRHVGAIAVETLLDALARVQRENYKRLLTRYDGTTVFL